MADQRYAYNPNDSDTGDLTSIGFALSKEDPNMVDAKYPLLPGVKAHLKLFDWSPAALGADEIALNTWTRSGGVYTQDKRAKTNAEKSADEQVWVRQELERADTMIFRFEDNHGRPPSGNMAQWRSYRNDLRDHVINDVVMGPRPAAPDEV